MEPQIHAPATWKGGHESGEITCRTSAATAASTRDTAEGDLLRPGSVVDVSIVPDIASNATKPVVLNPICVRSARTGAARREARRRGAPGPVDPSAARLQGVSPHPKGQRVTVVSLSLVFSNHSNGMEQPGLDDLADHSSMPEVRICSGGMVRSLSHMASLD